MSKIKEDAERVINSDRNTLYRSIFNRDSDAVIQSKRVIKLAEALEEIIDYLHCPYDTDEAATIGIAVDEICANALKKAEEI